MPNKTLLFLSADHFYAYAWKKGTLFAEHRFGDNAEGREQFAAFLKTHRDPVYWLTDLIEEDFRHEVVPHLRGGERAALLNRKFEQYYRNTPFRQALLLQRQADGRRDDEMLFSALTNPALVIPWLNVMLAQQTPIAGIYSVPNISAPLAKQAQSDHLLLLSWEKHAGLRQTYFDAQLLRFSRLTPVSGDSRFSDVVAEETARTQQYLKSLSLLPAGQALNVYIICHSSEQAELAARLANSLSLNYHYLNIQELSSNIGGKNDYQDSDATPLLLHLLAAKPPASHYAAPAHTHFFQLWKLGRNLNKLSGLLALLSLLWFAVNSWESNQKNQEAAELKQQADQLTQQTQQIAQSFSHTVAPAADMKTAVLLLRQLDAYSPPPQLILDDLSKVLGAFPRIQLTKLAWQTSAAEGTPPTGAALNVPAQVITLNGELRDFGDDLRGALAYVENFQHELARNGSSVTAISLPLDISAKGSIAADAVESKGKPAAFSLKIIWRPAA